MKYIVVRINGAETPVIFPGTASHKLVAAAIEAHGAVLSAGFINIRGRRPDDGSDDTLNVETWGDSRSTGIRSRLEDASLVQMCLHLPD